MKKRNLPLVVGMAFTSAATLSPVQSVLASDISVYGKVNLSLNKIEQESKTPEVDEWQLNSNASRLGVKGSHEIEEGLKAIYKMEFEVAVDDGDKKDGHAFGQRNIYAGLKGDFGTLIAGMHDTPLKMAQGKVDRFGDLPLADIKNIMEGEDRSKNIVMYTSSKMNGVSLTAAIIPGENSPDDDGVADGTSFSVNFKNDLLTAAIAQNGDVDGQDTTRVVADFNLGDSNVGLLWQTAEDSDDSSVDEDSWLLSAQHKLGAYVVKAQYGQTDYSDDDEDTLMTVGLDKKLGKKSKLFAYYSAIEKDQGSAVADDQTLAVGYEIKF